MKGGTFKEWHTECTCGFKGETWAWSYEFPLPCPNCAKQTVVPASRGATQTVYIATDDIPGGIEIRHGICNEDGSPKKYYSKTEMYRAANEKGLKILGDTPGKPYRVAWSGKVKEN